MSAIDDLKLKYHKLYSVSEDGTEYFFRPFTLKEVELFESFIHSKSKDRFELENFCLETCIVYPEEFDPEAMSPGFAQQVAEQIMVLSGIASADFVIEAMFTTRQRLSGDILLDIKSYIISAMPTYTDEQLDNYSVLELIEKLVLSEKILTLQGQLAGLDQQVELTFERVDESEEEEEYEVVRRKKPKQKPEETQLTKEDIIKRIRKENVEQYTSRDTYRNPEASDEWQGFDVDLLQKMEGVHDIESDPIARKLHGLE